LTEVECPFQEIEFPSTKSLSGISIKSSSIKSKSLISVSLKMSSSLIVVSILTESSSEISKNLSLE